MPCSVCLERGSTDSIDFNLIYVIAMNQVINLFVDAAPLGYLRLLDVYSIRSLSFR